MSIRIGCHAYQRGSQYFCDRCRVTWDITDDDPPMCDPDPADKPDAEKALEEIHKLLEEDK